jgi:hypothetical protein
MLFISNEKTNTNKQLKLTTMKAIKKKTKVGQYGETLEYNSRLRRWELVSN